MSSACSLLTETEHVLPNLIEVVGLSLLRGMQNYDGGAQDGEQAAHLAMQVQPLLEQVRGEDRTSCVYVCMRKEIRGREKYIYIEGEGSSVPFWHDITHVCLVGRKECSIVHKWLWSFCSSSIQEAHGD